jgi:hypothetical protein
MPLTQLAVVKSLSRSKAFKLADGNGLYLLVKPNSSKHWRFRYRFAGTENMLAFGTFPRVTLSEARQKREAARKLLERGINPSQQRKNERLAASVTAQNTFGAVAREVLEKLEAEGAASTTMEKNRWLLEDLARSLAARPIAEITPVEILDLLKRIEKTGRRETARRLRGAIGGVFRFAIMTLRATSDPTFVLRGALLRPNVQHRPALVDEREFGVLLGAIDEYDGWLTLKAALQLLALTMTRPGDVRHMARSEVDLTRAVWNIPAERMKMRRPHSVPLSRQALTILNDIWTCSTARLSSLPFARSSDRFQPVHSTLLCGVWVTPKTK